MKRVGNVIMPVLGLFLLLSPGCGRRAQAPARPPERLVRAVPTWGAEIEGLQCRLRPAKRLWGAGKSPAFKLDIRNQGKRLFAFDASQPIHAQHISLNGRRYRWPHSQTAAAKMQPLAPGTALADLALTLPRTPQLPLTPGTYDIAVVFVFEGVEVVSNSVGIEITDAP